MPCRAPTRRRHLRAGLGPDDVARRPDPGLAGAQLWIDDDGAAIVELDADRLEAQPIGIRSPARGDQETLGLHGSGFVPHLGRDTDYVAVAVDGAHLGAGNELDPLVLEDLAQDQTDLGLVVREKPAGTL